MRFNKKKRGWSQRKNPKPNINQQEFLGTLRAKTTQEAKDFLKPMIPEKRVIKEGLIFTYYPDGRIEVISVYDYIQALLRSMREGSTRLRR